MSRILVTGATGRLGANAVAALVARGDDVRCMVMPDDPATKKLEGTRVELFEAGRGDWIRTSDLVDPNHAL